MQKRVVDRKTSIDFRVSFVGIDGLLYFSQSENDVKFWAPTVENGEALFQMDGLLAKRSILFPKDVAVLRIEMRFCDSNPLILSSTIRTKMKMESFAFTCSLQESANFLKNQTISFPICVHLERSPNFNLSAQSIATGSSPNPVVFTLHKRSGYQNRQLLAGQAGQYDCDVLLHAKISFANSSSIVPPISKWVFFISCVSNDDIEFNETLEFKDSEFTLQDVRCEFSFADGKYGTLVEQRDYSYPVNHSQTNAVANSNSIGKSLYKDKEFTDITLKAGDKTFKAHKAVLSSTSPVFRVMFDHEMKERESGIIVIEDVDPDILERMLRFMYTGVLDEYENFDAIAGLFVAGDKYQIKSLKDQCSARLVSVLCSENVCRVLHLAYMHDDENLKEAAKIHFCMNPSEVLDSDEWKTFMENCIRGRTAKGSFLNQNRLRRSIFRVRRWIRSSEVFQKYGASK